MAAFLIADVVFFYVTMNPESILRALKRAGLEAAWLQSLDGTENPTLPLLRVQGLTKTHMRATSMNLIEISRLLLELVDLDVWCEHIARLLAMDLPDGTMPWPCFRDEWKTWA
jgi:hypothetical protein